MLSALLYKVMRLSVPRGGKGLDVSKIFAYFDLGGIYVLNALLNNIMRLSVSRGGRGLDGSTRYSDFQLGCI
jgi:hypothetical protein